MPDVAAIPSGYLANLFLVFVRVGAMLFSAPLLSGRTVPATLKIGLAGLLAFLLIPVNQGHFAEVPLAWVPLSLLVLKEIGVGVMVGFVANLVFAGMQLAGQFLGIEMGFSLANVIDPLFSQSISLMDQLYTILAGLVFLAIDGHQMLILAIQQTLDMIPLGAFEMTGPVVNQLVELVGGIFLIGLRITLPVTAALLLSDIALGLMARTVPQMNVFVVGLPVKIFVGFVIVVLTMPALGALTGGLFRSNMMDLSNLLKLVAA